MKSSGYGDAGGKSYGRTREGAWIEINQSKPADSGLVVAPVRVRGLKYRQDQHIPLLPLVAPVRVRGLKYILPPNSYYY